jgi:hypothetical protein
MEVARGPKGAASRNERRARRGIPEAVDGTRVAVPQADPSRPTDGRRTIEDTEMQLLIAEWYANERRKDCERQADADRLAAQATSASRRVPASRLVVPVGWRRLWSRLRLGQAAA